MLDVLKEFDAKATFFVMGVKVDMHPTILQRMLAEGHDIGNHGWDHPVMSRLAAPALHEQLNRTAEALRLATGGLVPALMRPPYGNTNGRLNRALTETEGQYVILWSLDVLDWRKPSPESIGDDL